MVKPVIYIALPTYNGRFGKDTAFAALHHNTSNYSVMFTNQGGSSLLGFCFNFEWAIALAEHNNGTVTHFAMIHGDIGPEPGWIQIMLDEMNRTGADVLSAVSPIKGPNKEGKLESSTAIGWKGNIFEDITRIPLDSLHHLPESFSIDDIPHHEGQELLVNSGLMLVKLADWCHAEDENGYLKVFFTIKDRIKAVRDTTPMTYNVQVASEDWNFSRMAAAEGAKVVATRKVRLIHRGSFDYPNATEAK